MTVKIILTDGNSLTITGFKELHYKPFNGDMIKITTENCSEFSVGNLNTDMTVVGDSVVSILSKEVMAVVFD